MTPSVGFEQRTLRAQGGGHTADIRSITLFRFFHYKWKLYNQFFLVSKYKCKYLLPIFHTNTIEHEILCSLESFIYYTSITYWTLWDPAVAP
jgi:hypothetical protein